jgi:hypothetical protein
MRFSIFLLDDWIVPDNARGMRGRQVSNIALAARRALPAFGVELPLHGRQ